MNISVNSYARVIRRSALVGALVCALAAAIGTSGALADTYKLDGKEASDQSALKGGLGGGCSLAPSSDGTYACFSSLEKRAAAVEKALDNGEVPPGSTAIAPKSALTAIAKKKKKKNVARAAACTSDTNLHVDTYQHNTWGWMDYVPNWITFSSTFNNTISSDTTSNYWNAYYHDGNGGTGHYFSQAANNCHVDNDLGLDAFPGGGSWNNKFSSGLNN
jgi:hypothetical protein